MDESARRVWGNERSGAGGFHDGFPRTAPVDALSANAFGLHHIPGNLYEWCLDGCAPEFYVRSPAVDPVVAPEAFTTRVICDFNSPLKRARSSNRQNANREYAFDDLGVRPARALLL